MSEPIAAPVAAETKQTEVTELAEMIKALLARDRDPGIVLNDIPRRIAVKRAPLLSPKLKASVGQTWALWPLLVVNIIVLWAVLYVFNGTGYELYVDRISRILQLALIALIFDVWLNPNQHPDALEGPAQGARQYQRIYLVIAFVIAGCLTP
jgi:hypothetical protein